MTPFLSVEHRESGVWGERIMEGHKDTHILRERAETIKAEMIERSEQIERENVFEPLLTPKQVADWLNMVQRERRAE
jgi:hypothetical protein